MTKQFDYQGAKQAGYSDEEINNFLGQQPKQEMPTNDTFGSKIIRNVQNFVGNAGQSQESPQDLFDPQLLKKYPNFEIDSAIGSGYSPQEINEFLSAYKPERSTLEKAGRLGTQFALGAAERIALPYELGVVLPAGTEAQQSFYQRERIGEDLEFLYEKNVGKSLDEWDQKDQELYHYLADQIKPGGELKDKVEPPQIGIRALAEKATGLDFHPEGILEKGANWLGFIKNPTNIKQVAKLGTKPIDLIKAISPSGTEITRSLTAGTALQMAEEGNFGPAGTIAAAVVGDLAGFGPKGLLSVAKNPKQVLAQATNLLTGANSKKEWVAQIIDDANKAGVQLDAGTLTNSNLIRMAQARAAQSALSGPALDNFRKGLSGQIIKQYQNVVDELGTLAFENNHQAATAIRDFVRAEEKNLFKQPYGSEELRGARPLAGRISVEEQSNYQQELLNRIAPQEFENTYQAGETLKTAAQDIKTPIKEEFNSRWDNFNRQVEVLPAEPQQDLARRLDMFVREHEGSLLLGESSAENRVLQSAMRLRNALMTEDRALIGVTLNDLIKTKRTLGDVANWEFGGSNFQSAYKQLVGDIDRAVENTLERFNPELRAAYEQLNAEYSSFKDLFENKNVLPLFEPKNQNYNSIYTSFVSNPDKLRSLEDIMWNNPRGQQLINQVKRDYAQRVIENPNMTARDLRNLANVLGPQYNDAIQQFVMGRQRALENPLPRVARQQTLGTRAQIAEASGGRPLGKVVEKPEHARRKLFEYIKGKDSGQILKMMDTIEGIRKLKRALSLTSEGKELFGQLARYKLFEMIDKNMMDSLKENVKLGTFSNLFKSTKSQAVVKELVRPEAFKQIQLLQKNAGRLAASAEKFYNASKSGTTIADVGVVSTLLTGIFTGNPYMALSAAGAIGGMKVAGHLLTDVKFLKYLEQAILTNNKQKFLGILKTMQPMAEDALIKASLEGANYPSS